MGETKPNKNAVLDEAAQKVRGSQVTIIADLHNDSRIHSTTFALATQSGAAVALEFLPPNHQAYLDAFSRKDITREQFLTAIMPGAYPGKNSPDAYLGKEKAREFYNQIADFVEQGGKIYAVGTSFGIEPHLDNDSAARTKDRIYQVEGQIYASKIIFLNQNKQALDANPKEFAMSFLRDLEEKSKDWPPDIQEKFVKDMQDFHDLKTRYGDSVYDSLTVGNFHCYTMPHLMQEKSDLRAQDISNGFKHEKSASPERDFIDLRQMGDKYISENIKNILTTESKPLLVVYGALHTTHEGDIDYHLRLGGIVTNIFDFRFQKEEYGCLPDKNESERCEEIRLIREWVDAERIKQGDPSRYTVHVDSPHPETAIELLKPKPESKLEMALTPSAP